MKFRSYFSKTNVHLLPMRRTTKKMRTLTVNVSGFSDFHFIWLAIYFAFSFFIFSSLSVSASDLISRLVRGEVCRGEQIQSHPFFKGVNWNEVSCTQFSYTVLGPFGQRVHAKNDHPPAKKYEDSGHEIAWVLPIYTYTLNRWHNPTTRYCKVTKRWHNPKCLLWSQRDFL